MYSAVGFFLEPTLLFPSGVVILRTKRGLKCIAQFFARFFQAAFYFFPTLFVLSLILKFVSCYF